MRKQILITGGNGYIAKSLHASLHEAYDVAIITRKDFDLTDTKSAIAWLSNRSFDAVIHTAAVGGSRLSPDTNSTVDCNLKMHYNLLNCSEQFGKIISFGSGAEIFKSDTPYGMSKKIIAKSILESSNWFNLRIFAVFDENELATRFIKANMMRYISKEPMQIDTNKIMDFFYMQDLVELVKYYIEAENPPKEVNCSYEEKRTLLDVATLINSLDTHTVPITVGNRGKIEFYCGGSNLPNVSLIGLEQGMRNAFMAINA